MIKNWIMMGAVALTGCTVEYIHLVDCDPAQFDQVEYVIEHQVAFEVDSDFSAEQRELISLAFARWHRATRGAVNYQLNFGFESDCSTQDVQEAFEQKLNVIHYCTTQDSFVEHKPYDAVTSFGKVALIMDRLSTEEFFPAVMHELGHLYGLGHRDSPYSLMSPQLTPEVVDAACIDRTTVRQFCQVNECPFDVVQD